MTQTRSLLVATNGQSLHCSAMDQSSFNSHSTQNNFFSRVYTTSMSSNTHRSYLSTTRPRLNTPSFFAKSHIVPHSAGRNSESHITSATFQAGGSSSLHPSATEGGSIYATHKAHPFSHGVEDANNQHVHDNMDSITRGPLPPRLEPSLHTSRAGTPNSSPLSLEF